MYPNNDTYDGGFIGSIKNKLDKNIETDENADWLFKSDNDRFGDPLVLRKPLDLSPGPGQYNSIDMNRLKDQTKKSFFIHKSNHAAHVNINSKKVKNLGPGQYDNTEKPKNKESYHFWNDEDEKIQPWI